MSEGLSARLRAARTELDLTVEAAAEAAGVTRKTWERYEKGGNDPQASSLTFLLDRGIDAHWLLTGEGEMFGDGGAAPVSPEAAGDSPSEELIHAVIYGVSVTARDLGIELPSPRFADITARMMGDLVKSYDTERDRHVGLKVLLRQLREDLAGERRAGIEGGGPKSKLSA